MTNSRKIALTTLLALLSLSLAGCASDYYYHDYSEVVIIDEGPIGLWPAPDPCPYPEPIVVAEQPPTPPRHTPLPKPVVKPAPRTKEPPRQPRTPAPRTPKPRGGGGTRLAKSGEVRR